MPGPFPGMDPFLENPTLWPDLHQSLITYIRDALQPQIRPRYQARMGERVYLVNPPYQPYFFPDIGLVRRPPLETVGGAAAPVLEAEAIETDEPTILIRPQIDYREPFLEIYHAAGGEVVTAIEVLSPFNKTPGEGRERYLHKQQQVLSSRAHLVEIDLLSQGLSTLDGLPDDVARLPYHRYRVSVHRFPHRSQMEVYTIALSRPLPAIRVPLKAPDPDVTLALQAVLNRCYDNGGYADFINYRQPPPVPLNPEEQFWMESILRDKGLLPSAASS